MSSIEVAITVFIVVVGLSTLVGMGVIGYVVNRPRW